MTRIESVPQQIVNGRITRMLQGAHGFAGCGQNINCWQEAGSFAMGFAAKMLAVKTKSAFPAIKLSTLRAGVVSFISVAVLLVALSMSRTAGAALVVTTPQTTTVVIYVDHPLPEGEWPALQAAIRGGLADAAAEAPAIDTHAEVILADGVPLEPRAGAFIPVFLHGNCYPNVQPLQYPGGEKLGWVKRRQGQIEPFIHVDCTRIGELLEPAIYWWKHDRRIDAMGEAIARVILHEWIHIVTQSPAHGGRGIGKAHFGVDDLLPNRELFAARLRSSR
jgi:hypothetical protein